MHTPQLPAADRDPAHTPGHWLLARIGKRVLRPGGKETTQWLLSSVDFRAKDVVELAPGMGLTAKEILQRAPRSYLGIDRDENACEVTRTALANTPGVGAINQGFADNTGLEDSCCDIVVMEAMLSMHTDAHKEAILKEVSRILRPGGVLLSHELLLTPATLADERKEEIRKDIARAIHVNARPLTESEWGALAARADLEVSDTYTTDMALLEPKRVIADEGLRTFKIIANILKDQAIRKQVLTMRNAFAKHADNLGAIGRVYTKTHTYPYRQTTPTMTKITHPKD